MIRTIGAAALADSLGAVEAERFITLILREPFDYTKWRQPLFENMAIDDISAAAARHREAQGKGLDDKD
ncbi:MAG: hypothetical protein LAT83_21790 [Kiritimatiellae bacterium]|nr:hypothetical protein [Kiritimatiellia bacterium]